MILSTILSSGIGQFAVQIYVLLQPRGIKNVNGRNNIINGIICIYKEGKYCIIFHIIYHHCARGLAV